MPVQPNFLSEKIINLSPTEAEHEIVSGRQVFEHISRTGLNRSPVVKLIAFIMAGGVVESGDVHIREVDEFVERHLVDGSIAYWHSLGDWINDIYILRDGLIITNIRSDDDDKRILRNYRRVFRMDGERWRVTDEVRDNLTNDWKVENEIGEFPRDDIFVFENGRGILYWPQRLFWRLEEIEGTIKEQTGRSAMSIIITGFMGDADQAEAEMEKNKSVYFFPSGTTATRIHATEAVAHLLADAQWLLQRYNENVFNFLSSDGPAMSGASRRLIMSPMLQFIRTVRQDTREVMGELFDAELEFDKVQVETIVDRQAEYDLLIAMRDASVLTPEEFKDKALTLL